MRFVRSVPVLVGLSLAFVPLTGVTAAQAAAPPESFSAPTNFPVGLSPFGAALGDLNGDYTPDIVTANFYGDSISVLLGKGDGTFGTKTDSGTGKEPVRVELADLNGDGKLDAVVTNNASASVSLLPGLGDGTFGPALDLPVGAAPRGLAVEDLNGDSAIDIVATSVTDSVASVLMNKGDGTFGPRTDFATGGQPSAVAIADLNFDGLNDLVVSNRTDDTVSVLLGLGSGGFGAPTPFAVGQEPSSVVVDYLDADGNLYAAVANGADGTVSVLKGLGDGTLGPAKALPVGGAPATVRVTDLNLDGNSDIVTANTGSDTISAALGNPDGTFDASRPWATGSGPDGLALGDVNSDGIHDAVTANSTGNNASVLLNTSLIEPPGSLLRTLPQAQRLVAGATFTGPQTRTFNVRDLGPGIPTDVSAVAMNLTVANTTAAGNAQVFPGDLPDEPDYPTSVLNWISGERLANGISVKVAPDGSFKVRISSGKATVFVDVVGYYVPLPPVLGGGAPAEAAPDLEGGTFVPLDTPTRVFDKVINPGESGAAEVDLSMGGALFDPAAAVSVVYNVTATGVTRPGHLRIQPAIAGAPLTPTSTLNWTWMGDVVANSSMVPVAPNGKVRVYVAGPPQRVILDVQGYFVNDGTGAAFHPIDPQRVLDTRTPGDGARPLGPSEQRTVVVTRGIGIFGEPVNPSFIPSTATAVAFNLTEVGGSGRGHFRAFPSGSVPLASINNWPSLGHPRANATMLGLTSNDELEEFETSFELFNSTGNADAIVDVLGYFD